MIQGITKLEFNARGFKDILFSPGVKNEVQEIANRIQAEANSGVAEDSEGFSANVVAGGYGGGRYVGHVTSIDQVAAEAEAENKVLSKAVH